MTLSSNSMEAEQQFSLVRANPAQQAARWRLHHQIWGEGFDLTLYLRRESALCESEYCRSSLAMWLLQGPRGEPLASCETYASDAWVVDLESKPTREPMHTIASVVVDPTPLDAYRISDLVGSSPAILDLTAQVARLRHARTTVLIQGESGTGKELVARALHFDGPWRSTPFIPLHCGAIAPELVESELFGHEKGAFTGAAQARAGLFQAADGGTIFLDEIAETSMAAQIKLLRVLQRGEIRPVGANQPRHVDVRVVAATHRDLARMVREGTFREDLYYRLHVVTLQLPPLCERLADLPLLVEQFLERGNRRHDRRDRPVRGCSRAAIERLAAYPWPGNVRELENAIVRLGVLADGPIVTARDVAECALGRRAPSPAATLPTLELAELERRAIAQALQRSGGDKTEAARTLGIAVRTLYNKLAAGGDGDKPAD